MLAAHAGQQVVNATGISFFGQERNHFANANSLSGPDYGKNASFVQCPNAGYSRPQSGYAVLWDDKFSGLLLFCLFGDGFTFAGCTRPDMEPAPVERGDFPGAPNAFAFAKAAVEHVV